MNQTYILQVFEINIQYKLINQHNLTTSKV